MGIKDMFKNGFRKPKKLTNAQRERQEMAQAFISDYKDLCTKHKLQLQPIVERTPDGGFGPNMRVAEFEPPKLKNWGEAMKENLEAAKKCTHRNEGDTCIHCAVRSADQHESGTGVTETYEKVKLEKIQAWHEKADGTPEDKQEAEKQLAESME